MDAGKTTLSEALLHSTGAIRTAGRVDHGDAFLDTDEMERERGITIFSKQARFVSERGGLRRTYTLLDTPGHADFSTEMERVLGVLDAAVLVISAADGVNGQVRVLWRLLDHYGVPAVIFVNKMDQQGADRQALLSQIREELGSGCVDWSRDWDNEGLQEDLAVCDEHLMNRYLEGEPVTREQAASLIRERKAFPVLFGSALRETGVGSLLEVLDTFVEPPSYGEDFGARIFKITRDRAGARLTWMKITGGSLKVKTPVADSPDEKGNPQKIEQIRLYSGERFEAVQEVSAGEVCAVTGLTGTRAGDGLGIEHSAGGELLQPVLRCALELPPGEDLYKAYRQLLVLQEEDPMLGVDYDEEKREITMQVMGQVQREILQRVIRERFGLQIRFGRPSIVYKETIAAPVEGVGHFEPLRHYAEVHLLLEPGGPGSGIVLENRCRTDILAASWQRLIMTHLEEKVHRGVLTGSPITDIRITLLSGKAHEKHTEGGDFRQATYRAVRQGLMCAQNVLLEPFYRFRMALPQDCVGRALTDLQRMGAKFSQPDLEGNSAVIEGSAPVSAIGDYIETLTAYSRGEGQLTCSLEGYAPCADAERVVEASGYDPEADLRNPSASVFCSHGVGTIIPWYEVREYMHQESSWSAPDEEEEDPEEEMMRQAALAAGRRERKEPQTFAERERAISMAEDELRRIFERTYGPIRDRSAMDESVQSRKRRPSSGGSDSAKNKKPRPVPEKSYLLVDGYNIIFAWEDLRELAQTDIMAARDRLIEILAEFAGFRREHLILVFDAYKVRGGRGEIQHVSGIDVVYTKEAETADLYIEKAAHELSRKYTVTVATSDSVEQVIIFGTGALRMSARNLLEEILRTKESMTEHYTEQGGGARRGLLDHMSEEEREALRKGLSTEG